VAAAAPDDRHLAVEVERVEHQPDVAWAVPAGIAPRLAGAILELAREQRAALLELAEDVAAERALLGQELSHPALRMRPS
jgi:hypothetical protein